MDALLTNSSMLSEVLDSSVCKSDSNLLTDSGAFQSPLTLIKESNALVFIDPAVENAQSLSAEIVVPKRSF